MPLTNCPICDSLMPWSWEDAFDEFGFCEGNGAVMTYEVAEFLMLAGFEVEVSTWGVRNEFINFIRKDGTDLIPTGTNIGYDDPRSYLPPDMIQLLDQRFPEEKTVS